MKPLSPGTPIDANVDHEERAAEDRGRLPDAAELGDLPGVTALVEPPDEEEQCRRGDAVVHHLDHAARHALSGEREGAEHDEPRWATDE